MRCRASTTPYPLGVSVVSKRLQRLIPSQESAKSTPVVVGSPYNEDTEIELGFTALELEEMNIEACMGDCISLEAVAVGLESIAALLTADSNQNPKLLTIAVDGIVAPTGLSVEPSLESVNDTIEKIWAAIKAAIKAAMVIIKKWWLSYNNQLPKVQKRAEGMLLRAKKLQDEPKESTVNITPELYGKLMIKPGKLPPLDTLPLLLTRLTEHWGQRGMKVQDYWLEAAKAALDAEYNKGHTDSELTSMLTKYGITRDSVYSDMLPGVEKVFYDEDEFKLTIVKFSESSIPKSDTLIKTLSPNELVKGLENVIAILDVTISEFKAYVKATGNLNSNFQNIADKLAGKAEGDNPTAIGQLLRRIGRVTNNGPIGQNALYSHIATTLNYTLDAFDLSIKQYAST